MRVSIVNRYFHSERNVMMEMKKSVVLAMALALFATAGCSNMSARDKNTAVGAAVGGVAGAVLTGGSGVGTVGGAAVGGIIGNQIKR